MKGAYYRRQATQSEAGGGVSRGRLPLRLAGTEQQRDSGGRGLGVERCVRADKRSCSARARNGGKCRGRRAASAIPSGVRHVPRRVVPARARRQRRLEQGAGARWCRVRGGYSVHKTLADTNRRHFACCLGDTLASELGILSRGRPRLITTLQKVPPGTNGAMSVGGTIASVVGGAIVGLLAGVTLLLENKGCSAGNVVESVGWGIFGGGFGSLVDSFLGATVQETRYSQAKGVVVAEGGTVVAGWNVLSNNQVCRDPPDKYINLTGF